jgi:hypothetical protein
MFGVVFDDRRKGDRIMKKAMFTILVTAWLLGNCALTLAQDDEAAQQDKRRRELHEKVKRVAPSEMDEARRKAKIQQFRRKDRNREQREKRRQELIKKMKEREKTHGREPLEMKGKAQQARLAAIKKRMTQEKSKNLRRTARLNRIHQLAKAEGDTKTVERVAELIRKEQTRYSGRHRKMRERMQMFMRMQSLEQGPPPLPRRKKSRPDAYKALRDKAARNRTPPRNKSKETTQ